MGTVKCTATVVRMGEKPIWETLLRSIGALSGQKYSGLVCITEDWIHLLGDSDESSSPAQLL